MSTFRELFFEPHPFIDNERTGKCAVCDRWSLRHEYWAMDDEIARLQDLLARRESVSDFRKQVARVAATLGVVT